MGFWSKNHLHADAERAAEMQGTAQHLRASRSVGQQGWRKDFPSLMPSTCDSWVHSQLQPAPNRPVRFSSTECCAITTDQGMPALVSLEELKTEMNFLGLQHMLQMPL